MNSRSFFLFLAVALTGFSHAYSQIDQKSLECQILHSPEIVTISSKPSVYFELIITNHSIDSIVIDRIDIINSQNQKPLTSFNKSELQSRLALVREGKISKNTLPPASEAIAYVELSLPTTSNLSLTCKIVFGRSVIEYRIPEIVKTKIVLGPPLQSGLWAAVYEPSWVRGHRRVIYSVNGKPHVPGRFAIDFIRMNNEGKYAIGNEDEIKNWLGYGNEVLAVADGVVASTRDDFPESQTLSGHPGYSSDKASGNYISIDIGDNHFAFYEHLKPGSIKVKSGQKVKKGDVIGLLGYTGQTTGPHLHFHVANADSPLDAEGIAYSFESFTILGSYSDMEKFGKAPWAPRAISLVKKERPAPNAVIQFK